MKFGHFRLISVLLLIVIGAFGVIHAADSATITFSGDADQPQYDIVATNPVDDGGGCDRVTMLMTDATDSVTDIDNFCLTIPGGIGVDYTDWGSIVTGYTPVLGPITYSLYDTASGDACDLDENSVACFYLLIGVSGSVECIAENYFQPASLPAATPNVQCSVGSSVSAGCQLSVPSGSVVGDAPAGAQAYYSPGNATNITINPGTYIVIGQDESETYYKIVLACQYLWVRKDTMQPSFLPPQNGTPLPTRVVS